jgi:hypothetical protein
MRMLLNDIAGMESRQVMTMERQPLYLLPMFEVTISDRFNRRSSLI